MRRSILVAVAGAVLAAAAVTGWQAVARSRIATARATTAAYVEALEPLAREAGRIVELGLKDGLQQVSAAAAVDPTLTRSARSYQRQLATVRDNISALETPTGLDDSGFVAAVNGYIAAAGALERAAQVPAAQRAPLVDDVTAQGRAADDLWDAAAKRVQTHLAGVGLETVPWLPG